MAARSYVLSGDTRWSGYADTCDTTLCQVYDGRYTTRGAGLRISTHARTDAAIAANAVLAVTAQHMCGLGGDLFALVHAGAGPPAVLNASGRAGRGASAAALRIEGLVRMPHRHHVGAVTVPGCVDGWLTLHERFGRVPLTEIFAPAIALAVDGFLPSPLLVAASSLLSGVAGADELVDLAVDRPVR